MIDQLYQKAILKHAASATGHGRMENADKTIIEHNPLCGDRITLYLKLDGDKITDFCHETKACVLCQASASILGGNIRGEDATSLQALHDTLTKNLQEDIWSDKAGFTGKWTSFNIFQPVSDHKNRFSCVTLPLQGLLKALIGGEDE